MLAFLSLMVCSLSLGLGANGETADLPDPNFSSCGFPEGSTLCVDPVTMIVQVNSAIEPMSGTLVEVIIELVSGSLISSQLLVAEAWTGIDGNATVVFPDGVVGSGIIFFRVFAMGVKLCESAEYTVLLSCPVPVQPASWSLIKARYR